MSQSDRHKTWPAEIDLSILSDPDTIPTSPADARVFDALIGGMHNFSADRDVAQRLLDADPRMRWWAIARPSFRNQAMIALAGAGCRQWIDLGSGLPTWTSAYDLLATDPSLGGGRLACVDTDPIVVIHTDRQPAPATGVRVAALRGDLREPEQVMAQITRDSPVDLGEPVVILLTAVLHHLDDNAAGRLLAVLREYVVAGSVLVLSHLNSPAVTTAPLQTAFAHYQHATGATWTLRDITTAANLLGTGWAAQPPGVTAVGLWHPTRAADDPLDDQVPLNPELQTAPGWAVLATASAP